MGCILVVDDDEDTRETLQDVLVNEGFDVRVTARAEEAVAQVSGLDAPSLVLLDSRMRDMSGIQFLDWISGRRELDDIPVVLMTGDTRFDGHQRAAALLRKPYELDELLRVAYEFCKPRRRGG
jgi:CheY-like chemotaxis protein